MKLLKLLFPLSFGVKDVVGLIIHILIYIFLPTILGFITWLLSMIPVVGSVFAWIFGVISGFLGVYCIVGIVLLILAYLRIIK